MQVMKQSMILLVLISSFLCLSEIIPSFLPALSSVLTVTNDEDESGSSALAIPKTRASPLLQSAHQEKKMKEGKGYLNPAKNENKKNGSRVVELLRTVQ
jgi:hypothetical protein